MSLQSNIAVEIENELDLERWFEMGGPGSGNWGHRGRKGKRGGSMPGGGKGHKTLSAPVGDVGMAGNSAVGAWLDEGAGPVSGWAQAHEGQRATLKIRTARNLSEATGIPEEDCADFVKQWAHSSNDDDMRSLAIQKDAAEEFGVKTSKFTQDKIKENQLLYKQTTFKGAKQSLLAAGMSESDADAVIKKFSGKEFNPLMDSPKQKALLRAMYDKTQADLKERGIKEVRLYRGVSIDREVFNRDIANKTQFNIETNAVESWSISENVAGDFAYRGAVKSKTSVRGVIFETVVPAERILSTPTSGFGCLTEGEVVVLGGISGDTAKRVIYGEQYD